MCAACQVGEEDTFFHEPHDTHLVPGEARPDPHSHTLSQYFGDLMTSTVISIGNLIRLAIHWFHDSISYFMFSVLLQLVFASTTPSEKKASQQLSSASTPPSSSSSSRCHAELSDLSTLISSATGATTEEPNPHREDEGKVRAKREKRAQRASEARQIAALPIDLDMASGCVACRGKGYRRIPRTIRVGPSPRIVNNMYIFTTLHYIGVSCIIKANRLTWLNLLLMYSHPIACFITKFARGNVLTTAEMVGEILSTFLVMLAQTFFLKHWFEGQAQMPLV